MTRAVENPAITCVLAFEQAHRRETTDTRGDFPLGECDAAVMGNRGAAVRAKPSAELVHDLRRDELKMVEVMQVEHLKIDPVGTHF